jgi:CheY-like chemotaxis protein
MSKRAERPLGPVLVVDDDPDIREIVELALVTHGYRVETARDGRDCLQKIRTMERPSIVILDLMMPEIDGWSVCDELANDPELATVPVVILTGDAQIRDERRGRVPIVKKPIELANLLAVIEKHAR